MAYPPIDLSLCSPQQKAFLAALGYPGVGPPLPTGQFPPWAGIGSATPFPLIGGGSILLGPESGASALSAGPSSALTGSHVPVGGGPSTGMAGSAPSMAPARFMGQDPSEAPGPSAPVFVPSGMASPALHEAQAAWLSLQARDAVPVRGVSTSVRSIPYTPGSGSGGIHPAAGHGRALAMSEVLARQAIMLLWYT